MLSVNNMGIKVYYKSSFLDSFSDLILIFAKINFK